MKNRYTNPDFFVLTDGCSVVTWGSHKLLTHLTEAQDKANKLTYLRLNFSLTVSRLRNRKDIKGEKEEKRLQVSDFRCLTSLQYGNHEATNVEKMSEVVKTKCIWVWQQQHSRAWAVVLPEHNDRQLSRAPLAALGHEEQWTRHVKQGKSRRKQKMHGKQNDTVSRTFPTQSQTIYGHFYKLTWTQERTFCYGMLYNSSKSSLNADCLFTQQVISILPSCSHQVAILHTSVKSENTCIILDKSKFQSWSSHHLIQCHAVLQVNSHNLASYRCSTSPLYTTVAGTLWPPNMSTHPTIIGQSNNALPGTPTIPTQSPYQSPSSTLSHRDTISTHSPILRSSPSSPITQPTKGNNT